MNFPGRWSFTLTPAMTAVTLALAPAGASAGAHAQEIVDLPGEDRLLEVETEEVFIGQLNANGWRTLGLATRFLRRIRRSSDTSEGLLASQGARIGFDAQGRLYILDPGGLDRGRWRIFVVDPEGDLVRDYEVGEGDPEAAMYSARPAEFVVASDGGTVVADLLGNVFRTYSPVGAPKREASFTPGDLFEGSVAPSRSSRTTEAVLTVHDSAGERVIEQVSLAGATIVRRPLANVWRASQEDVDAVAGIGFTMLMSRDTADAGSDMQFRPSVMPIQLYVPKLSYDALADGGVAFVDSSAYAVKLIGPDGELSRILRRPLRPRPVTDAVRSAQIERLRENAEARVRGFRNLTDPDEFRRQLLEAIEGAYFYPEIPAIRNLRTTWEGTLWVRRSGEEQGEGGGPIDVLTPDGRYRGTFDSEDLGDLGRYLSSGTVAFGPDGLVAYVERGWQESFYVVVRRLPEEVR